MVMGVLASFTQLRLKGGSQHNPYFPEDFLRVVAGDRPAKSRKRLCRAPNRCDVISGQMAKVELRLYPKTARLSKMWAQASSTSASQFSAFFAQRVRRLRRLTNHEIVRSTTHLLAG